MICVTGLKQSLDAHLNVSDVGLLSRIKVAQKTKLVGVLIRMQII